MRGNTPRRDDWKFFLLIILDWKTYERGFSQQASIRVDSLLLKGSLQVFAKSMEGRDAKVNSLDWACVRVS